MGERGHHYPSEHRRRNEEGQRFSRAQYEYSQKASRNGGGQARVGDDERRHGRHERQYGSEFDHHHDEAENYPSRTKGRDQHQRDAYEDPESHRERSRRILSRNSERPYYQSPSSSSYPYEQRYYGQGADSYEPWRRNQFDAHDDRFHPNHSYAAHQTAYSSPYEQRDHGSGRQETFSEREGFSGRGPKGYQRSDERIREEICDRLCDHNEIDASEIEVKVESGLVTLSGTVEDRRTKRLAEDAAEHIRGIKDINNQIRVQASDKNQNTTHSKQPTSAKSKGESLHS